MINIQKIFDLIKGLNKKIPDISPGIFDCTLLIFYGCLIARCNLDIDIVHLFQ